MPVILPEGLACVPELRGEGIEVLQRVPVRTAVLRVGLVNLMPDVTRTEVQFARLLGATERYVELVPALPSSYRRGHAGTELYARWGDTSPPPLDGLIVTGAPLEHVPFEQVSYWPHLACIFDWAARNVGSTLYVCWAAFAALYRFHRVHTRLLPRKLSGVYQQQVMDPADVLTLRLGSAFPCPVSRHAEVEAHALPWRDGLVCLAKSSDSGLCLVADARRRAHYMFNHLEYDADTLSLEYLRDSARSPDAAVPRNYFPNDDSESTPPHIWRRTAEKLFSNWLALLTASRRDLCLPYHDRSAA